MLLTAPDTDTLVHAEDSIGEHSSSTVILHAGETDTLVHAEDGL